MNVNETKYTTYLHNFSVFFNIGFQWHDKVDVKSLELQEKPEEPKKKNETICLCGIHFLG